MKKPKPIQRGSEAQDTLLADLESIRALLDASPEAPPAEDDAADVPMLEDMVEGAFVVNETLLTSRSSFDDGSAGGRSGLADDTIKALLGDEWRAAARKILADARSIIDATGGNLSTQQTNALNDALKVRIDHTLDDWLVEMMHSRIDDLRSRLIVVLAQELESFTRALTDTHTDADSDADGQ